MGWINSDDKLHPNALNTINKIFTKNKKVHWIQGIPNVIDAFGKNKGERKHSSSKYTFFLKLFKTSWNYFIQQESTFWIRNLWEKAGGCMSEEYSLAGDFELWMRFFRYENLYNTNHYLGTFRISEQQLSKNRQLYLNLCFNIQARLKLLLFNKI